MNKNLKINGKNIKIQRGSKSLTFNGENLEEMICEKLPSDIVMFEDYFANIEIYIEIEDGGKLETITNYNEEDNSCQS